MIDTTEDSHQYLTFKLAGEDYALQIGNVREVLDTVNITKVPRSPEFLRGVINLRGTVMPVVDLELGLGMSRRDKAEDIIIVVEADLDGERVVFGALADSVKEVADIDPQEIEPPPKLGTRLNVDYIKGMGKCGQGFVAILDIDRILCGADCDQLTSLGSKGTSADAE